MDQLEPARATLFRVIETFFIPVAYSGNRTSERQVKGRAGNMCTGQKSYIAYLVRLWRVKEAAAGEGIGAWRASLESPQTGERIGFGSVEELFTYLRQEMELCVHADAKQ